MGEVTIESALRDENERLRSELAYALNCQPQFFPAEATRDNCERLRHFQDAQRLLAHPFKGDTE